MMKFLNKKKKILFFLTVIIIVISYLILRYQFTFFHLIFPDKTWVHKVNDLQKLESIDGKFTGIELDINYVDSLDIFDVYHAPDISQKLYLSKYFEKGNYKYWLDFKNLSKENYLKAFKKLNALTKTFNIDKKSIIIESTNPEYLPIFLKEGYLTSYYLTSNLLKYNKEKFKNEILKIENIITEYPSSYISSSYGDYFILKKEFPDSKIITWVITDVLEINSFKNLRSSISKFKHRFKVFNDDNVEVVLIRY